MSRRATRTQRSRGRWLGIALLLAVALPLASAGVGAEPEDARGRSLSPEARRAAREVYQAQLRLRAAVHDPRRDALLAEIRRAKELVPSALGSHAGGPAGLPPKLAAQKQRIEGLLEELRSAYFHEGDEGRRERLAELDRIEAALQRLFDECESIAGLPHGPARSARRKRFLEELHLPQAERGPRRPAPMLSRPARSPLDEPGGPTLGLPVHPQRRGAKP